MALPSALAAKLSKRGLIATGTTAQNNEKELKDFKGAAHCPNKYNIFHDCTLWCQTHWKVHTAPEPKYAYNIRIMLEKYPLPHNWTEVFDKGIGRYYYWNMETNLVSWLPPKHPKAKVIECAAKLRMKLHASMKEETQHQDRPKRKHQKADKYERDRDDDKKRKYEDKYKKRHKRDILDPMDPAAYSDIPKGTWSDGLENNKSKADTTASGALFQQRPYPAPGEVLASNSKHKKRK